MENEKMFDLMSKIYAELQSTKNEMKQGFSEVNSRLDKVENRLDKVEKEVTKLGTVIDGEVSPKITALFDGYKANSEQLNRIEKEVSKHEEVILRRIK